MATTYDLDSKAAPAAVTRAALTAESARAWAVADVLSLTGASPFLTYCNSIGTNLEVLHRYDNPAGTPGATTTADRRTGQSTRTGTMSGGAWGFDSALDRGSSKAVRVGESSGFVLVNSFDPADTATFTYAMVVRFNRFNYDHGLIAGSGTGFDVVAVDTGTAYTIRLQKNGTGVVADSTVTITDTWRDHLIIVSMGGSTASTRIVIDGVECTGSITTRTTGTVANRFLGFTGAATTEYISLSAYAEWSRQLTTTEEANLLTACQFGYRPRPMLHGIHAGLQFFPTNTHVHIVEATAKHIAPHMARLDLRWFYMQATNGGTIDWSKLDNAIDQYLAAGIQPLLTIAGSPTWASGGSDEFSIPDTAAFGAWVTAYATFVTAAATRYKERVKHWELGNEPNYGSAGEGFWRPMAPNTTSSATFTGGSTTSLNVVSTTGFASSGTVAIQKSGQTRTEFAYTGKTGTSFTGITGGSGVHATGAVVQQYTAATWGSNFASWCNALRTAILALDPTAKVCTGGLLGWDAIGVGLIGAALATQAFANGLSTSFSYYGIHPYSGGSGGPRVVTSFDNNFAAIRQLRDHLILTGRGNSTIWATEFGWYGSSDATTNIAQTTTYVDNAISDLRDYHSAYVDLFCLFCDFDRPTSGFYGLLTGYGALGNGFTEDHSAGTQLQPRTTATTFKRLALPDDRRYLVDRVIDVASLSPPGFPA